MLFKKNKSLDTKTPLLDFLEGFINSETSRFFMPGHKGNHPDFIFNEISRYDITEISGADSLFEADGILLQSEEIASSLYGTGATCYSAGGSTLCIQAMLALTAKPGQTVIAARNAHKAFFNTCTLLDLEPFWVMPAYNDSFGVSGEVTAEQIKEAIKANPDAAAVYVTSPDYMGCMSDIAELAKVCKKYDKPLLVDNAHGAHLRFLPNDLHPITLGATLCCDSAHKTLPVLTGGAYLHCSMESGISRERMKEAMGLFGSTSPSYLIMLSLDICNRYLFEEATSDFALLCQLNDELTQQLCEKGHTPISSRRDPTKLTIDAYAFGYTGDELADIFREAMIECEYSGERHLVLMLSPLNCEQDIMRLREVISELPQALSCSAEPVKGFLPKCVMSLREAAFSKKVTVPIDEAIGRISAVTKIKCPPGVPLIASGELIDSDIQKLLKKSSNFTIDVIE